MPRLSALLGACVLLCASAPAAAIICSGQVAAVNLAINGMVEADFGLSLQRVCSLNSSIVRETGTVTYGQATITPEYCKVLTAQLMTARNTGATISAYYDATSCPLTEYGETVAPFHWVFPR